MTEHIAAWVNKGKKAPGMHIHKAIKEGDEEVKDAAQHKDWNITTLDPSLKL